MYRVVKFSSTFTNDSIKGATCKNWPLLKFTPQTDISMSQVSLLTAAAFSILAQLAMKLVVQTGSSQWYFEKLNGQATDLVLISVDTCSTIRKPH